MIFITKEHQLQQQPTTYQNLPIQQGQLRYQNIQRCKLFNVIELRYPTGIAVQIDSECQKAQNKGHTCDILHQQDQ